MKGITSDFAQEPEPEVEELETEEANIGKTIEGHEVIRESENQVVEVSLNYVIGLTSQRLLIFLGLSGSNL